MVNRVGKEGNLALYLREMMTLMIHESDFSVRLTTEGLLVMVRQFDEKRLAEGGRTFSITEVDTCQFNPMMLFVRDMRLKMAGISERQATKKGGAA